MKVIVGGPTGFIGNEVLTQCLLTPKVTTVYTLSRRPLDSSLLSNPKLKSIVLKDFLNYPNDVLQQLAGASACIWTIGQVTFTQPPRLIDIAYSQAAASAFATHLQPLLPAGQKFRFIHTSGFMAEKDQSRYLWFLDEPRKSKGQSEVELNKFAADHAEVFETFIVRAGMVLRNDNALASILETAIPAWFVNVRHLALAMIGLLDGSGPGRTIENTEVVRRGHDIAARTHP